MVDFHSHVLPKMDDGSRGVQESIEMLKMETEQGITTVFATPHFYPWREKPQDFLARRKASFEELAPEAENLPVRILLGAEVAYFPGIGAFDDLGELRMADTNLILLEMPFERWSVPTIRETIQISSRTGLTPVLAHVERFLRYNPISSLVRLAEGGCLIQCNAELFLEKGSLARKILKHLDVEFIGSDAHGSFSRAPNIGQAESRIRKSFPQFWTHLEHTSERLCSFLDT